MIREEFNALFHVILSTQIEFSLARARYRTDLFTLAADRASRPRDMLLFFE